MRHRFITEAKQVRDELVKTVQNLIPLSGADWQGWNKARRVKIRTDIESILIMYDQAIAMLDDLDNSESNKQIVDELKNRLNFYDNE